MNIQLIAEVLDTMGVLLVGWAALRVHHRVLNEHKIDTVVFRSMKREQRLGFTGLALVAAGFVLKILFVL
jgi:hypothetical protein